jgi:hypothetical protein
VDDASGETIELILSQKEHRDLLTNSEEEEQRERYWKYTQKPKTIYLGSLVKVKGELIERWHVRKIQVMKLGIHI